MCSRTAPTTTTTTRALRVAVMKDAERTATSGGDANGEDSRIDTFLKVKNVKEWLAAARPIPFPVADLEAFSERRCSFIAVLYWVCMQVSFSPTILHHAVWSRYVQILFDLISHTNLRRSAESTFRHHSTLR
ncbi:hypothetical protein B0H11DRAFT_2188968 [Mycena galericulata]|nr:hypothetical protein B0H11DRAFT_2188968 [Mycena galericulata]